MITPENFTRIDNDINGNPRYVIHFLSLITEKDGENNTEGEYKMAIKRANTIGGRKYHTKSFGGGIVFQSYNIQNLCDKLNDLLNSLKA